MYSDPQLFLELRNLLCDQQSTLSKLSEQLFLNQCVDKLDKQFICL